MPKALTGNEGTENDDELEPGADDTAGKGKPGEGTEGDQVIDETVPAGKDKPAADAAKPDAAKPDADGKEEGAEGEPKSIEEAVRKSLDLETKPAVGDKAKPGADEKAAAKPGEEKPGEVKPDAKPEAEKPDLYTIPEGLKQKSTERFQQLVTSHKEISTVVEQQKGIILGFRDMVKETGADNVQFMQALDLLTLINTKPGEAAKRLSEMAVELATMADVEVPGVDFLKDFPDLQKQVEDREITSTAAREIAKGRRDKVQQEASHRQTEEARRVSESAQAARTQVLGNIESFLNDKEKNDIDWPAKASILIRAADFAAKNLPLNLWLSYLQEQYDQVGAVVAKAIKPANNSDGNRPLRPSGAGGGNKQPGNMLDAVKQSLGLT